MYNLRMRYLMLNIDEEEMQRTPTIVQIHPPPFHQYSACNQMWLIRILARMGYIKNNPTKSTIPTFTIWPT
jgi:hypothetical protein